jgi:hypothetical protein
MAYLLGLVRKTALLTAFLSIATACGGHSSELPGQSTLKDSKATMTNEQSRTLDMVRAERAAALGYIEKRNFIGAIAALKRALELIGHDYGSPDILDDTGQRVSAAKSEESSGRVANAATILSRVLDSRIKHYPRRNAASKSSKSSP